MFVFIGDKWVVGLWLCMIWHHHIQHRVLVLIKYGNVLFFLTLSD
jgi:hypothetical protein